MNYFNQDKHIQSRSTLRGGGCGASNDIKKEIEVTSMKQKIQIPEDFSQQMKTNTEIICQAATLINDQSNQCEVMISIQWFICMEEKLVLISCNQQLVTKYFDLIKACFINMLSVINIYLRTAGTICLHLLRIMNQLSKIIFYFYLQNKNSKRFMKEDEKQDLLQTIIELETQMEIEAANIWVTGIEFEIQLLKACIKNLPSDSKQGQDLIFTFLGSAANSVLSMSLDDKLIDTLIQGATYIIDKYQTHNLKQFYQLFYSLDLIKWSLISQLKENVSITKILYKLQQSFNKFIMNSTDWMTNYCWIKLIGDLLQYRPIIQREDFQSVDKNAKAIWNKLVEEKFLTPLAFNKLNYARVNLTNDSANYLENIHHVSKLFKGIEELKKLQEFLINSKNYEFNVFSTYLTKSINPSAETQQTRCRNFLFLDKSSDYISNFYGIAQSQMAILVTNLPALLLKLKDFSKLLSNEDSNMVDLQVQYYKESLEALINQAQSIIFLLIFNSQFTDYYLSKQNLVLEGLQNLSQLSEKETKTIVKMKEGLQKLNSFLQQNIMEKHMNQLFQISEKLRNVEQIIIEIHQNQLLNDEIIPILDNLDQIIDPNNQQISVQTILIEWQDLFKQLIVQHVQIQTYQNKIYEDSKSLNISQLNLMSITVRLVQEFQFCMSNFQCFDSQLQFIEKQIIEGDSLLIKNSNFTLAHLILSLERDLFQLQVDFWDRCLEYFKEGHNNQSNNKLIKNDFLPLLEETIRLFQNVKEQPEMQTIDPQFECISKKLNDLKIHESATMLKDILNVQKIISKNTFFKIQLQIEYLEILNNMKIKYETIEINKQNQQVENQTQNVALLSDIIPIVTYISEQIRKMNTELNELCQMGKQIQEIIQGSQQTLLETKLDNVNEQITKKLKSVISLKIEDFIKKLQEHRNSQESLQTNLKKFQSSIIYLKNESMLFEQMEQLQQQYFIEQAKLIFSKLKHLEQLNEKSFFGEIFQQVKDKWDNQGHKLREAIAVSCIFISSNISENQIQKYCQDTLVKIWAAEKDERVKKILKNKDFLVLQTKLFSSDLKNANEKLKDEIQSRFQELEKLEQELKQEGDPQKRDKLQQILQEEFKQFEEYVDNMNDMNSELKLQIEFLKTITKQLKKMEEKIDQLQTTLNDVNIDLKFLRGKKFDQLLLIRKQYILQNKNQIDLQSVYVDLRTIEKDVMTGVYLNESDFFVEDISNEEGEVNEFLWGQKDINKEVMLIHGCAGSGKSTAARKIEQFLWLIFDQPLKKDRKDKLLPIYVSLPTIKEPEQNAVEQALESESYHFDSIQLREFKEAVGKKEFRLVLILDSYDEIKSKFISKNLFKSNRLKEVWGNPKVIFTTRTEILTSHHYPVWFYGTELSGLKEIEIQRFNENQRKQYLEQFCQMSVKKNLIGLYKYYLEIENKKMHDLDQFIIIWRPIQNYLQQVQPSNKFYLTNSDVKTIIKILKKNDFIKRINEEQIINFEKELANLWGKQKFDNTIQNIQIENLLETPFMMEIVVQVLPIMTKKYTDYIQQKEIFIQNFTKIKEQQKNEKDLINFYKYQNLIQDNKVKLYNNFSSLNQSQKPNIVQSTFNKSYEEAAQIWEELEVSQFFAHFSIASKITRAQFQQTTLDVIDQDIVISALESHNLTQYDFYQSFVEFYHNSQIQKLRNQNKQINYESILLDLNEFSMKLALEMTKNQLTQVQYKCSGQLKFQINNKLSQRYWEDDFFNDLELGGDYKKLIRSAVLLGQKGSIYFFVHKSIQEFLIGKYMYELFQRANTLNLQLLQTCMEFVHQISLKQEQSFVSFLKRHFSLIISEVSKKNGTENDLENKMTQLEKDLTEIISFLSHLLDDYVNLINLSKEEFFGSLRYFKEKINLDTQIRQLILQTSKLSAIDHRYVRFSSNFLYLLTNMFEYLGEQDFRNIVLQDTSIAGGSFHGSDFSGSVMKNVNISGVNLNRAVLANVEWTKQKINELPSSLGHTDSITCIDFSPNGSEIVSSSMDKAIKLWDANTGKIIKDFIGHSNWVLSVAFSPDSSKIASCGCDKSIILWSIESGQMEKKLLGHNGTIKKLLFSHDGFNILSGGDDLHLYLWDLESEDIIKTYKGHLETINSFSFNRDGTLIVSCSQDQRIIIWDTETTECNQVIQMHAFSVGFSPDSERIVSGGHNQIVYIWDVKTGNQISKILGHTNTVLAVCYSKDGNRIATGSSDKTIRLWDSKNTKEIQRFEGHLGFVNQVIFSPNGQKLVSSSKDNTIRQWDITVSKEAIKQQGHSSAVNAIQFTPDGLRLISGGLGDQIQIWDAHTGKLQTKIKNSYNESIFAISPDGELIASRSKTTLMIRNLKTKEENKIDEMQEGLITSIVFSYDGKQLACSNINDTLTLWDVQTLKLVNQKSCQQYIPNQIAMNRKGDQIATVFKKGKIDLWGVNSNWCQIAIYQAPIPIILGQDKKPREENEQDVLSVAFSPDDKCLVLGYQNASINLWNLDNNNERDIKIHTDAVTQVAFTLDGNYIISTSNDYTISIYDIQKQIQTHKLQCHQSEVLSLALSVDGKRFAAGSWDKTISLWKFTNSYTNIRDQIQDWPVYYLEDKKMLVSGSFDNKVRIWNLNNNSEIAKFSGHQCKITAVTITKDCQKIAASNINNLFIIWNALNGQEIWRYKEDKQLNSFISFSNSGEYIAFGGIGDLINIYDISKKLRLYSSFVEPMIFLEFQSYLNDGWEIDNQNKIINQKNKCNLPLVEDKNCKGKLSVSCYKVISEYLTSLKSNEACIFKSNIRSQLGFDIKILLEQRGGLIKDA